MQCSPYFISDAYVGAEIHTEHLFLVRVALALGMWATAIHIRGLFQGFAFRAAIFALRNRAGTNWVRAFFSICGFHFSSPLIHGAGPLLLSAQPCVQCWQQRWANECSIAYSLAKASTLGVKSFPTDLPPRQIIRSLRYLLYVPTGPALLCWMNVTRSTGVPYPSG